MKIFIYGTLMKDLSNYRRYIKGKVKSIIKGEAEGLLYHLPAGYPAVIEGAGIVKGEIAELSCDSHLISIDTLEGYIGEGEHNLYDRVKKEVKTYDGSIISCWMYLYQNIDYVKKYGTFIPDGDWRNFKKERNDI